jgi:hypothetical protein
MGVPAKQSIQIPDYLGLFTRPDPNDIKPGSASLQINVTCVSPGALVTRQGLRPVKFDNY